MTDKEQPFKFSDLVKLYCDNWEVVSTLEARWKEETRQLAERVKTKLAKYDREWDIYLSNTYGWLRDKAWGANPLMEYQFWFDKARIGKGTLQVSIHAMGADRELRERICEDLREKIKATFGAEVNPKNVYIASTEIDVSDGNYGKALLQQAEKCIDFAKNLDPYARVEKPKSGTK